MELRFHFACLKKGAAGKFRTPLLSRATPNPSGNGRKGPRDPKKPAKELGGYGFLFLYKERPVLSRIVLMGMSLTRPECLAI